MAYGYRSDEVNLPEPGPSKPGTKISPVRPSPEPQKRPPVQVSLGLFWLGVALPQCDPSDGLTMRDGVRKRFAMEPPPIDPTYLREFGQFVDAWLPASGLQPLRPDSDTSLETWLDSTLYPAWRREELARTWQRCQEKGGIHADPRYMECKSFMKDENYPDYKQARGINARSDEFKCFSGPIFRLIEKEVFKLPYFIKKVSVADRPSYIVEKLRIEGATYVATDYTAFEALFRGGLMMQCEFKLYKYMSQFLPNGGAWYRTVTGVLAGINVCHYKYFTVRLPATRMSGEMCTSLGNGFSNLMFMLFICHKVGCTNVMGVVEGDDGLFRMIGTPPTTEEFAKLGLVIKADVHHRLETASFCGLVFDVDDLVNVTNPLEVLAGFGWTRSRYARASNRTLIHLLRAKAYSLLYQYPGCPMLQSLGCCVLRNTRNFGPIKNSLKVAMKTASTYERELFSQMDGRPLPLKPVPWNTRLLVETLYGVTVEHQRLFEAELDRKADLGPLFVPYLTAHPSWHDYWDKYVMTASTDSPDTIRFWPAVRKRGDDT